MANLRSINIKMWADEYIADLKPSEKLMFVYLLTNPFTRLSGTYKITIRQITFDTGIGQDAAQIILDKFQKDRKIIYRGGWIVLLNFLKNQNFNSNMKICVRSELADAPIWVSNAVATVIKSYQSLSKAFEGFQIEVEDEVEREIEKEDEIENENESNPNEKETASIDARAVFEHWQKVLNHPGKKFDKKREARIRARLKDGFSVEDLKLVPLGVLKSPHHMGENKTGTIYHEIETIYRDVAQVEKFIELSKIIGSRVNTNGTTNGRKPSNADVEAEFDREYQRLFNES